MVNQTLTTQLVDINLANTQVAEFRVRYVENLQHINLANTPMEKLYLGYSEALESINIEGMTSLHDLAIGNNHLVELDLTTLVELEKLSLLDSMGLESLIFPEDAKLGELTIKNTALPELDLSDLKELVVLYLGSRTPKTREEDILKLGAVKLDGAFNLRSLKIGPNELNTLDLSSNELLTNLEVGGGPLRTLLLPQEAPMSSIKLGENSLSEINIPYLDELTTVDLHIPAVSSLNLSNGSSDLRIQDVGLYGMKGEVILPEGGAGSLSLSQCGSEVVFHNADKLIELASLKLNGCGSFPVSAEIIEDLYYLELRDIKVPDLSNITNDQLFSIVMSDIDNDFIDLSGFSALRNFFVDDDIVGCHNPGSIIFSNESNLGCAAMSSN